MLVLFSVFSYAIVITLVTSPVHSTTFEDFESPSNDFLGKYNAISVSNDQLDALATFIESINDGLPKRSGTSFNPRLGKRLKRTPEISNDIHDEFFEESNEHLRKFPLVLILVAGRQTLEKGNRFMTPRLGRDSNDALDASRARPPFAPRLGRSSLPFSPRLGRSFSSL